MARRRMSRSCGSTNCPASTHHFQDSSAGRRRTTASTCRAPDSDRRRRSAVGRPAPCDRPLVRLPGRRTRAHDTTSRIAAPTSAMDTRWRAHRPDHLVRRRSHRRAVRAARAIPANVAELTFEHRPDEPVVPHDAVLLVIDAQEDAESEKSLTTGTDSSPSRSRLSSRSNVAGTDSAYATRRCCSGRRSTTPATIDRVPAGTNPRRRRASVAARRPRCNPSGHPSTVRLSAATSASSRRAHRAGQVAGVGIAEGELLLRHVAAHPRATANLRVGAPARRVRSRSTARGHRRAREERQPVQNRLAFDAREGRRGSRSLARLRR